MSNKSVRIFVIFFISTILILFIWFPKAQVESCRTDHTLKAYECLRNSLLKGQVKAWHDDAISHWIKNPDILKKVIATHKAAPDNAQSIRFNFLPENRDDNKYFYLLRYGNISSLFIERLEKDLQKIPQNAAHKGSERGNYLAWRWGYAAEAAQLAFKRTGNERFAKALIDSFQKVLDLRDTELNIKDDYHNKIMNAWGSGRIEGYDWVAHVTLAGRILRPVTELLEYYKEKMIQN